MSTSTDKLLTGVAETLLLPLYIRAIEAQRPDAEAGRSGQGAEAGGPAQWQLT